jgi:hypothetical protein
MTTPIANCKRVGQYVGVSRDGHNNAMNYRVILYAAKDAFGLIGSEFNGIAILDEVNKMVVTDNLFHEASGYNGPSRQQEKAFELICAMNTGEMRELVNNSPMCRGQI